MIAISDDLRLTMAQAALRRGDLESCRGLLAPAKGKAHEALRADVSYRLGKQHCAQGRHQAAKLMFADAAQHHALHVVRALSHERIQLINAILGGEHSSEATLEELLHGVHVEPTQLVDSSMLLPEIAFVGCLAAYRSGYDRMKVDPLSTLIRLIKHGADDSIVHRLGALLAAYVRCRTQVLLTADFLLPVPTHPDRETARGYSIPRVLAEEVSRLCAIPIHDELLRTGQHALELRHVPRWYRPYAVHGAFHLGQKAEWLKGQIVMVIDDVLTTGSTVREVARVISEQGAAEVNVVALAHTESSA